MSSNFINENISNDTNIKTEIYSNNNNENSFTKINPSKSRSTEYISTNIKREKIKKMTNTKIVSIFCLRSVLIFLCSFRLL